MSAAQECMALHTQAAAQESVIIDLKQQLEAQKLDIKRTRLEAASAAKRQEQALQRLRREADAGCCVLNMMGNLMIVCCVRQFAGSAFAVNCFVLL